MSESESTLFTYGVPFVGVILLSIGIAAAVPGAYALLQDPETCGEPTIDVEGAEETAERFADGTPATIARLDFVALSGAEQEAFEEALDDALGEAKVRGDAPNIDAIRNGTLVSYEGEDHYVTLFAENPCYDDAPLQFPLGVFAVALGIVGILTPPGYRRLVKLEEGLTED